MRAHVDAGWVCVPYDDHDLAPVYIGIGHPSGEVEWRPALLDDDHGSRIAKASPGDANGPVRLWLRTNDIVTSAGRISL